MDLTIFRRKRVVIPAVATAAVLAVGSTVATSTADDRVDGAERERVADAAVEAAGGGTAVDVETSDDRGAAYEVEVRLDGGSEVDVTLDGDLEAVGTEDDDADDRDDRDDADDREDGQDADDRALDDAERSAAEEAALAAVGGGTVLDVEASDDRGVAYDVEVRDADGAEWDVDLDDAFALVHKSADD